MTDRATDGAFKVRTAGLTADRAPIEIRVGIHSCGDIKDGLAVRLPKEIAEGPWVISFADFEKAYLAARKVRGGSND